MSKKQSEKKETVTQPIETKEEAKNPEIKAEEKKQPVKTRYSCGCQLVPLTDDNGKIKPGCFKPKCIKHMCG